MSDPAVADIGGRTTIDPESWTCPIALRGTDRVVMGHGGGGILSEELIEHLFLPALGAPDGPARDSALIDVPAGTIAMSTDSYVVHPLFFPGGSIGDLAVNGTINDLAMSGAWPVALTAGFILEEGVELDTVGRVAQAMGAASRSAYVPVVTGDTKVVDRGAADQLYVNTAGVGIVPAGVHLGAENVRPGDRIICSGSIGEHGVAIMSVRDGIDFGTVLTTDSAPLHRLVADMIAVGGVHALRDPTRGGLVASVVEIIRSARLGAALDESLIPIPEAVAAACGFLGLDPLHVANEGKLIAFVAPESVDEMIDAMRRRPEGQGAVVIGTVVDDHPSMIVGRTAFGTNRVIERELGEQLPRIC